MSARAMRECRYCHNQRPAEGKCPHCGSSVLPADYEACGECGFDHDYEAQQATTWHTAQLSTTTQTYQCDICQDTGKYRLDGIQKEQTCEFCELGNPRHKQYGAFDFDAYNGISQKGYRT